MSKTPNQNTSKVDASIHPHFFATQLVQLCLSNCLKFYAQHNVFSLVAWHWLCATTKNFTKQKTTVVDKMESLSIFWANKDVFALHEISYLLWWQFNPCCFSTFRQTLESESGQPSITKTWSTQGRNCRSVQENSCW